MMPNWSHTKSVLTSLESKIKCFICGRLPINPHILWCKHSFCKACILYKKKCPKCNLSISPQDVVPNMVLNQLLLVMKTASEMTLSQPKTPNEDSTKVTNEEKSRSISSKTGTSLEKKQEVHTPKELTKSNNRKKTTDTKESNSKSKNSEIKSLNESDKNDLSSIDTVCTPRVTKKTKEERSLNCTPNAKPREITKKIKKLSTPKLKSPKNSTPKSSILFSAKKSHSANKLNVKGETPLQIACRQGKLALVQRLLRDGAEPNVKDYANWTPLCDAVGSGNIDVVKALLEAGAGVNTPSNLNTTALVEAVVKKNKEMVRLLLSYGADINQRTALNNTPLSLADDDLRAIMLGVKNITIQPLPRTRVTPRAVLVTDLAQEEVEKVMSLCKKFSLTLSTAFTDEITHVVVRKSDSGTCEGSQAILLAVLSGCSVAGLDWVTAALQVDTEADLLSVDGFEPSGTHDHPHSNVFQTARLNREHLLPRLFDGCHVSLLHEQAWTIAQRQDLAALVQAGGAVYQPRAGDPERIPLAEQTVMFHAPPPSPLAFVSHIILYQTGPHEPLLKYNMAHIKSFSVSWFMECIKVFSIS